MNLHALLSTCEHKGVSLRWDGKAIKVCGAESAIAHVLPMLRQYKPELCDLLQTAAREPFEERAGIMQFDGELSRDAAERRAHQETLNNSIL